MTAATLDNAQNEALIAEMLRDAKTATDDSSLTKNPIVSDGSDPEAPVPMIMKEMTSAGYVWLYDTRTFEPVKAIRYMVPQMLATRRLDGSFRFTTTQPKERPARGSIKCLLNPDNSENEKYSKMGFRQCRKANITNDWQLQQHMLKKHPQEWKAIQDIKTKQDASEEREMRKMLLNMAGKRVKFVCPICEEDFGAQITLDKHIKSSHK